MKKTLLVLIAVLIGFSGIVAEPIEWRPYHTPRTFVDINGASIDLAAVLASGKPVLIEYTWTSMDNSWQRHQAGVLEAIKYQFGSDLCVVWVGYNDTNYRLIRGQENVGEPTGTKGDWTLTPSGNPVSYYITNDTSLGSMTPFDALETLAYPQFFAPTGYSTLIDMSADPAEAVSQVMALMYDYPAEGEVPELEISGPSRAIAGRSERYTAHYNSDIPITSIEWSVYPHDVELSCTDCGNPLVYFSPNVDWGSSWGPSSAEIMCTVKTSKYIVNRLFEVDVRAPFAWRDDTLTYHIASDGYEGGISAGSPVREYGIMIPAARMRGRNCLVDVMQYIDESGQYTLNIYQGGDSAPRDLICTKNYDVEIDGAGWHSFPIDSLQISPSENLWVTFATSSAHRTGAYTAYSGDSNGCWLISTRNWTNYRDRTWMIRAVTSANVPTTLNYTIDGPATAFVGATAHYEVTSGPDAEYGWFVDGNEPNTVGGGNMGRAVDMVWQTAGTYRLSCVAVRGDLSGVRNIDVTVTEQETPSCETINLPYQNSFNSADDIFCWTAIDHDGDGHGWGLSSDFIRGDIGHSGSTCVASASWNDQDLTPDNYFVSPAIPLPQGPVQIEWWDKAQNDEDYAEHYALLLSTQGTAPADFSTVLYENTINEPQTWRKRHVSLSDMQGQTVYLAFRHFDCTGQFFLLIDDIKIYAGAPSAIGETLVPDALIYPNPTTGKIQVRSENIQRVELLDPAGHTLQTIEHHGTQSSCEMDITHHPAGLYYLRITTAQGVTIKTITKQ